MLWFNLPDFHLCMLHSSSHSSRPSFVLLPCRWTVSRCLTTKKHYTGDHESLGQLSFPHSSSMSTYTVCIYTHESSITTHLSESEQSRILLKTARGLFPYPSLWLQVIVIMFLYPASRKLHLPTFCTRPCNAWCHIIALCPLSHVVFAFWLQVLSVASRWRWSDSCTGLFCWSLRGRFLRLTGSTNATRMQPMWRLKYQELQRRWKFRNAAMSSQSYTWIKPGLNKV